jgi:hypothetical protein
MSPPEANIEIVVMARNLPNDCMGFSIPGGAVRDETVIATLLCKYQRAKTADVRNTLESEAVRRVVDGFKLVASLAGDEAL